MTTYYLNYGETKEIIEIITKKEPKKNQKRTKKEPKKNQKRTKNKICIEGKIKENNIRNNNNDSY